MTGNLVLFCVAVAVCIVCLFFWLRRLAVEFGWLQVNYIELHGKYVELEIKNSVLQSEVEQSKIRADHQIKAATNEAVAEAQKHTKILMYQVSAQQALLPSHLRAKAIYEE